MTNKSPKRLPDVPKSFNNIEEVTKYLRDFVRECNDVNQRSVEGPINDKPFTVPVYEDLRDIDSSTITHADLAKIVATLIVVLQKGGVIK